MNLKRYGWAGLAILALLWAVWSLSGRSHSHTYRYFAPLVWSFPFVVAYLYRHSGPRLRGGRAGAVAQGHRTLAGVAVSQRQIVQRQMTDQPPGRIAVSRGLAR